MIDDLETRKIWLYVVLVLLLFVSLKTLSKVFWTIFLAGSFAYVLYPIKDHITGNLLSDRQSAALVTFLSFLVVIIFVIPILLVLFQRRQILFDFMASLPGEVSFEILEFSFVYPTAEFEALAINKVTSLAVSLAESMPSLSIKTFLFIFVLYAILKHSKTIENEVLDIFPKASEETLRGFNERIKQTLVGIFAVQTFTAVMTFIIALPVFYFLGYSAFIALALISAIFQFLPIVGPIFVILALTGLELAAGFPIKAATILVFGIVIIGFLPDAYLKPKIANRTTGLPASLYFVGFAGGALTLGAIGILAGPLIIALLIETLEQITK